MNTHSSAVLLSSKTEGGTLPHSPPSWRTEPGDADASAKLMASLVGGVVAGAQNAKYEWTMRELVEIKAHLPAATILISTLRIHIHTRIFPFPFRTLPIMKAIVVSAVGKPAEVTTDTPVPEPNATQILVKAISAAVNPVDSLMADMGIVAESFPLVPGCDGAGVVVKAGADAVNAFGERFKEGDEVFGCTRVGVWGYAPWQEYVREVYQRHL